MDALSRLFVNRMQSQRLRDPYARPDPHDQSINFPVAQSAPSSHKLARTHPILYQKKAMSNIAWTFLACGFPLQSERDMAFSERSLHSTGRSSVSSLG